jgi:lipopolysaccharide transport system permease protein
VLPLFIVVAEAATFVIGAVIFACLLAMAHHAPSPDVLALPWIFLVQQMLALGIGMILGVLNVFLRDVREFSGILIQLWFWATPIVWAPQIMSPALFERLKQFNPMASVATAYQGAILGNARPDYDNLAMVAVAAACTLALGYVFVRRMEKDMRDLI